MIKLLINKSKLYHFRTPLPTNLIRNYSFQTQEDLGVHKVSYIRDDYTDENLKKIDEYQQMTYQNLIEEIKKHPNRPKGRSKNVVLQFLIDQIPKKAEEVQENIPKAQNEDSKELELRDKHDQEVESIHKFFEQSIVFQKISDNLPSLEEEPIPFGSTKKIPYIETFGTQEIDKELTNLKKIMDYKREIDYFVQRSSLFAKTTFAQKVKKVPKEEYKKSYRDLILLEKEFSGLFRNNMKNLINDTKSKGLNTIECLETLRSLDDPIVASQMNYYFKNLAPNSMLKFWKTIFNSLDKYDLHTIDVILKHIIIMKNDYKLNFAEQNQEMEIYDRISDVAVQLLNSSRESYSIHSISSLVYNFKTSINGFSDKTLNNINLIGQVLVQKYNKEVQGQPSDKIPMTPIQFFRIFYSMVSVAGKELENYLPDLYEKLVNVGFRHMDKFYINKILQLLNNHKLTISRELGIELKENSKVCDNLNLFEIYLLIHTFSEKGLEFNKIYNHLFFAFFNIIESRSVVPDIKNILIAAKITGHLLDSHQGDHKRNYFEKKIQTSLNLIEKSIEALDEKPPIVDLIEISSLFIPHLNTPDFLFRKILSEIDELVPNNENRGKLTKFVQRLLEKFEPKFTFNTYLSHPELEFNDKFTDYSVEIFRKLITKFKEPNLLSYVMLNIQITSNRGLLETLYPNQKDRKGLCSNTPNLSITYLTQIVKFFDSNINEINPNFTVIVNQKLTTYFVSKYSKPSQFNKILPWVYYIANSLSNCKKEDLNPLNAKQRDTLVRTMRDFVSQFIITPFCENNKLTTQSIIYDKNVTQHFNSNVFNSNFENLEYLLPTIDALNMALSVQTQKSIILQFPRAVKRWNGEILVRNLLLIEKNKIHAPEIFELAISNLFSLFNFFFDMQNFQLNKQILDESKLTNLLKAYINQKDKKHHKEHNKDLGQEDFTTEKKDMLPLGALLYRGFDLLTPEEIIRIIEILGPYPKNYLKGFINKFKDLKFIGLSSEKALELKSCLPNFLQNDSLDKVIYTFIELDLSNLGISLEIMKQERLWVDKLLPKIQAFIEKKKSRELFEKYLMYMGESGLSAGNIDFVINQVQVYGISSLSENSQLNLLSVLYKYEREKKISPENVDPKYWEFRQLVAKNLLMSELFYHFENHVLFKGKLFKLKYFGSFEMKYDRLHNSFKVLPKNRSNLSTMSNNSNALDNVIDEDVLETARSVEENQLDFKSVAMKFLLYKKYHASADLPVENQQIEMEFFQLQSKNFNMMKFKESYSNFLIDVTLILHEIGTLYKTNAEDEQSGLLIDIGLNDDKIAILYLDHTDIVCKIQNGEKSYHPGLIAEMKQAHLEANGWSVIQLYYDHWNIENDTKEKKEKDLRKRIQSIRDK